MRNVERTLAVWWFDAFYTTTLPPRRPSDAELEEEAEAGRELWRGLLAGKSIRDQERELLERDG